MAGDRERDDVAGVAIRVGRGDGGPQAVVQGQRIEVAHARLRGGHGDGVGGRRRQAGHRDLEHVAAALLAQRQVLEDRQAVGDRDGHRREGGPGRAADQREGRDAVVGGVGGAEGIRGRGDDAETGAGDDAGGRLGDDGRLAGQAEGGQVGDQEVGLGRAQAGDQVIAGPGGVAVVALGDVVEVAMSGRP